MEYYSPIKRNEAATTWMDIENIVKEVKEVIKGHTL